MIRRLAAFALDQLANAAGTLAARLDGPSWCWHITDTGTHFYPLRDGVGHEPTDDCPCGPTARLEECADHGDTYHYRHHPLTQADVED